MPTIIISWRAPNKLLVENPLVSILHIHSFSAHYREQHEKYLYHQSSHYGKYGWHNHQSTCTSYWYKSGCAGRLVSRSQTAFFLLWGGGKKRPHTKEKKAVWLRETTGRPLNTVYRLHFASRSSNVWLPLQAKNNVTSAPASTALIQVSHQSHYGLTESCTSPTRYWREPERNGIQRRTKVLW